MYVRLGRLGAHLPVSTPAPPELTFDEVVATFNANLVSYWPFATVVGGTTPDTKGGFTATINGFPELNVETIVKRDIIADGAPVEGKCIAWPGTTSEYAQVAHNAAHKTASGTVVAYFQRDLGPTKSQLIEADAAGAAGGMAIGVNAHPNGAPDAYIRVGGTPVVLTGDFGNVQLDRAYCLIFKWGAPGMSLALWDDAGALVVRKTNATTTGLSGTSTIRFGLTHSNTNAHDGPYGRVLWLNRRITDAEEAPLALAHTIARAVSDSYRALELSMAPVALWGLGEAAGTAVNDVVAGRNGTLTGAVSYGVPALPAHQAEKALDFLTTGSASVPHHAPTFDLAALTLSFWFSPNAPPATGESAAALVTKNGAVEAAGDLVIYLPSNDGSFVKTRFRSAPGVQVDINTTEGSVVSNTSYHVCVRADGTGFDMFLNGIYYGKNTGYTGAWTVNAAALRFVSSPTFVVLGNSVLDEVALFDRVLTVPEVMQLAQKSGVAPVANAGAAAVPEGQTTAIQVLANDVYVGLPTIEVVTPPAPDGAVVVPASFDPATGRLTPAFVNYVAGGVVADTARSFTYRITDPNGVSNTATVAVTVLAEGIVAATNANCYVIPAPGGSATTPVVSMAALSNAVAAANPGDHVVINNGTYAGGNLTFNRVGTEAEPIVIRGQSRAGVVVNDALWNLSDTSARIVITNITFHNARIIVRGTHHRITRCKFDQVNRVTIDVFNATDVRCDHCDFSDYTDTPPDGTNLTIRRFFRLDDANVGSGACRRILFDYNNVHDVLAHISTTRDMETVGLSASSNGAGAANPNFIIDHCLFDNISLIGDGEIIGAKTSGVKLRFCTFTNHGNCFLNAPRQANDWEIRSCWFENNQTTFMRAASENVLVIGNRFIGTQNLLLLAGTRYGTGINPEDGSGGNPAVRNGRVIGNVLESGQIRVGHEFQGPGQNAIPWDSPVLNTNICPPTGTPTTTGANTRSAGGAVHVILTMTPEGGGGPAAVGTTFNPSTLTGDEAFTPAVKLTVGAGAGQVGMTAPDPLCPTGPQT